MSLIGRMNSYGEIKYVEIGLVNERNFPTKTIYGPDYAYYDPDSKMYIVEWIDRKIWMYPREQVVSFSVIYSKENGE